MSVGCGWNRRVPGVRGRGGWEKLWVAGAGFVPPSLWRNEEEGVMYSRVERLSNLPEQRERVDFLGSF